MFATGLRSYKTISLSQARLVFLINAVVKDIIPVLLWVVKFKQPPKIKLTNPLRMVFKILKINSVNLR